MQGFRCAGFRASGLVIRIRGSMFRFLDLKFQVSGSLCRAKCLGMFRDQGQGWGGKVKGKWRFKVQGLAFMIWIQDLPLVKPCFRIVPNKVLFRNNP